MTGTKTASASVPMPFGRMQEGLTVPATSTGNRLVARSRQRIAKLRATERKTLQRGRCPPAQRAKAALRNLGSVGQVERMNRTIKDATIRRFHYETHQQPRNHLTDFVNAYDFGRRLRALKGLTAYEAICKTWTKEPQRFTEDPIHQMPGLNI